MGSLNLLRRFVVSSGLTICIVGVFAMLATTLHAQAVQFVPTTVLVAGTAPNPTPVSGPPSNGPATSATLNSPEGVAFDKAGNLYIVDALNDVVRKVDANGNISTFAGGGSGTCANATDAFGDGCPVADAVFTTSAQQGGPARVALDSAGNVYISDYGACMVHKVDHLTAIMTDYVGNPQGCNGTDVDGPLATARLDGPVGLAFDAAGNLYIAEYNSGHVREVNATDTTVTTAAGGRVGPCSTSTDRVGDGCPANSSPVIFNHITDLGTDAQGNVYISDQGDDVVRKITISTDIINIYAGTLLTPGYGGDGGPATSATLHSPKGIVIDGGGDLYFADTINNVVRKVAASGTITTVAGNGIAGYSSGIATKASLNYPLGLALSGAGDLYVSEYNNDTVRRVDFGGILSFLPTSVGQASSSQKVYFQLASGANPSIAVVANFKDFTAGPPSCTADNAGNLCSVAVTFGPQVPGARSAPLQVTTGGSSYFFPLVGTGNGPSVALTPGVITTDVPGLAQPVAIAADSAGNLYVVDDVANTATKVSANGTQISVATGLNGAKGVAVDAAGNVYIADTGNGNVLKVAASGGAPTTIASGLTGPEGVAVDTSGDVFVANTGAGNIVELPANGGAQTNLATGLSKPTGIAVDAAGNVYVVEQGTGAVVELPVAGGSPVQVATGLNQPDSIAVDAAANLYISETGSQQIVRVDAATHAVSTVAGNGTAGLTGNGGAATLATLNVPDGVAVDGSGNLYIADTNNQVVRKVMVGPSSATLAFMTTNIGATSSDSPQSANVTNIGNQPLSFSALGVTANFAIASTTTCSTSSSLALGTSCVVGINFTPTAVGNLSGNATLADNALNATTPQATQTIPLSGAGAQSVVTAPPSFSLTANPTSLTTKQGTPVGTLLTLTPQNGFNATVNLSCNGLPTGAACMFKPANVVMNGNNQVMTSQLTITTSGAAPLASVAANRQPDMLPNHHVKPTGLLMAGIFWLPGILLGSFLGVERKKLRGSMCQVMMLLVAVTGLLGMMGGLTGCAGGSVSTPPAPVSYQIAVLATPANGAPAQQIQLTLTITQ